MRPLTLCQALGNLFLSARAGSALSSALHLLLNSLPETPGASAEKQSARLALSPGLHQVCLCWSPSKRQDGWAPVPGSFRRWGDCIFTLRRDVRAAVKVSLQASASIHTPELQAPQMGPRWLLQTLEGRFARAGCRRCIPTEERPRVACRCMLQGSTYFSSVFGTGAVPPPGAGCYPVACARTAKGFTYNVSIGSTWHPCPEGGLVQDPSYGGGAIGPCPPATELCRGAMCPNDCSGKGAGCPGMPHAASPSTRTNRPPPLRGGPQKVEPPAALRHSMPEAGWRDCCSVVAKEHSQLTL